MTMSQWFVNDETLKIGWFTEDWFGLAMKQIKLI